MKKFFLTSTILSLGMLFAQPLTAQIKVLSNGDVKIADNPSSTSVRGVEIIKPNLTFTGSSVKFNFSDKTLEIKSDGNSSVFPNSSENISNGIGDPVLPYTGNITILGTKDAVELGNALNLFLSGIWLRFGQCGRSRANRLHRPNGKRTDHNRLSKSGWV